MNTRAQEQTGTLEGISEDIGLGGLFEVVQRVISYEIFELSGTPVNLMLIFTVGVLLIATWTLSNFLQRAVERGFRARGVEDIGTTAITKRLLHYGVMAIGLGIALETIGISLSALFAAGAIFAVGLGFAMQNIAQNFVSGLILLVERAIKPGDIVEVEGRVVRVLKMGIRTTIARTRDEEEIIIPNASLVQSTVRTTPWVTPSSGSGRRWASPTSRTCVRSGIPWTGRPGRSRGACRIGIPSSCSPTSATPP